MGKLSWFVAGAGAALAAAAISKELEKPASERAWRGYIAGIPYNFNIAGWTQIAREYWNPDSNQILTPHTIGIGWGINVAALLQWIQDTFGEQSHTQLPSRSPQSSSIER